MTRRLDFHLLGPLEVLDGARSLPLGGRKQRSLLALLLLHANEVVSIDSLMDGLWGERVPKTAGTALQVYVSNLRKLLSPERLVTRRPGYGLRVEPGELDLARFEGLCAQARGDEPAATATALGEALSLWRGPALCDFAYDSFAQGEIARLDELRLVALERRIEAELALGKHAELVGELEALVGDHPLRERLRELLILSLYRCGRQADALEAYRQARKTLLVEHGIEPSSSLKELEKSILAQDAELAPPTAPRRTNLPSAATPLIGRERELAELAELTSRARLVTLTGSGGSGKTRLALELAAKLVADYPDGVWWMPLAALRDPGLVEQTIAHLLNVKDGLAAHLLGTKDGLAEHLRHQRTLLVLDNFEQLVEAAPQLSKLLAETEHVAILVTSREPLHVSAEHQYPMPPLADEDAVTLFIARARQVTPGFEASETVAEICRRLDGLPLAIELAAARVKVLEPEQILARIGRRLELLTAGPRDAPERQRTLRATIEWSYELLDDAEQQLIAGLAVFVGGFDLEAAEAVCSADLRKLAALIDKNLLRPAEQGRFVMLETIREYALERLEEGGDLDRIRRRHFDFFLTLAEEASEDLERDQRAVIWLERFEQEHDNCQAALQWARDLGEARLELRLVTALSRFWDMRGHWDEGRSRVAEALARNPQAPADLRGHALGRAAMMAHKQGDPDAARALAEEATAGYRATGDTRSLAHALSILGVVAAGGRKHREARALFEESKSMFEELGDEFGLQLLLHNLGLLALDEGQHEEARRQLEASLALARKNGQERDLANDLCDLGFVALGQSRHDEAHELLGESLGMGVELGWKENVDYCLIGLAGVSAAAGELERAARLLGAAEALGEEIQFRLEPYAEATRAGTARDLDSRLGRDRFAAYLAAGRSLSLSEAVSLALADVG